MSDEETENERARRGPKTRERILLVAEELIARYGVDRFELKDVAAKVGIQPPSIFAHFRGREDLALAVARRVGQTVVDQLDIEGTDPEMLLRRGVRNIVAHLAANPAHVRILLADLGRHREMGELSGSAEQVLRAEERVQLLLNAGLQLGVFRDLRADAYIAFVLGGILASLAWYGWDESGNLQGPLTLQRVQDDAEELAVRFVRAGRDADANAKARDDQ